MTESERAEALKAQVIKCVADLNLVAQSLGEGAAALLVLAALKPLAVHQRRRVMRALAGNPMLRGAW